MRAYIIANNIRADNDPNKRQKLDNAPVDENMQSGAYL